MPAENKLEVDVPYGEPPKWRESNPNSRKKAALTSITSIYRSTCYRSPYGNIPLASSIANSNLHTGSPRKTYTTSDPKINASLRTIANVRKNKKEYLPARIHISQRIIYAVGIPVEALRKSGRLHIIIRAEEQAQHRIVDAARQTRFFKLLTES
jgi:hypothetical protein